MCNSKTLSYVQKGFVTYCKNCKHFQVAFGTTATCLSPEQFTSFCHYIEKICKQYAPKNHAKEIWICLNSTISLVLTSHEIHELAKILQTAQDNFTVYQLAYETKLCLN
jgi:hypothetical protein